MYIVGQQLGHMKLMKELEENTDVKKRRGDIKIKDLMPSFVPIDQEASKTIDCCTPTIHRPSLPPAFVDHRSRPTQRDLIRPSVDLLPADAEDPCSR